MMLVLVSGVFSASAALALADKGRASSIIDL